MLKKQLSADLGSILSEKEIEVVVKRLQNKSINQTESNYLSRSVRPKLRASEIVCSLGLLSLLEYRRKKYEREEKVLKEKILMAVEEIAGIRAILIYGSYIRNNSVDYRDIDVMILVKKKIWKNSIEKNKLEKQIENSVDINLDVNLVLYSDLKKLISYSPLFQTELENSKPIYGNLKLNKKVIINKKYLYKQLLEIEQILELGKKINSKYIYNAIRGCLAIKLFLRKKVDNSLIVKTIEENIGVATAEALAGNKSSEIQREIGLKYLKYLYKKLEEKLNE